MIIEKRRCRQIFGISLAVGVLLSMYSCSGCSFLPERSAVPENCTILTYNVQNLFDDVNDGTEYDEFIPATGGWNSGLFHLKLQRVSEVLTRFPGGGADIILLQEVENENALEMLRTHYLKGGGYRYSAVSDAPDTAVQTAVLSRFPITQVKAHTVTLNGQAVGRPILECSFEAVGRKLVLFCCHWKSKSGGAENTEPDRIAAAGVLADILQTKSADEASVPVLVAGDLNECIDEWELHSGTYQTALMPVSRIGADVGEGNGGGNTGGSGESGESLFVSGEFDEAGIHDGHTVLFSPWLAQDEYRGSYAYRGTWEKIDHFLLNGCFKDSMGIEYDSFLVIDDTLLLDDEGYPVRWIPDLERGYSDHLPLLLSCTFLN